MNTNMYVEAFHRVLKYVYMKGKVNKRLDKCIHVLLKLARDKGFERLSKIEKGKNTERIRMIKERHQSSLKLCKTQVSETDHPLTWKVQSTDGKNSYSVTLVQDTCPENCLLCCPECNICVHMFMCNCADALIRTTICKHIHLVSRLTSKASNPKANTDRLFEHNPEISLLEISKHDFTVPEASQQNDSMVQQATPLLKNLQEKTQLCNITVLRKEIQKQLFSLAGQLEFVCDIETLKDVRLYAFSAMNLIKARKNLTKSFPIDKNEPSNKLIEQQRIFFSTKKKKRKQATVRIRKPTSKEKEDICTTLLEKQTSLYGPSSDMSFKGLSKNTISKWIVPCELHIPH